MHGYRSSHLVAALALFSLICWLSWSFQGTKSQIPHSVPPGSPHTAEEWQLLVELNNYGIANFEAGTSVHYAKLELIAEASPSFQPPLLQNLNTSFLHLQEVKSINHAGSSLRAKVSVPVAPLPTVPDLSNIVFGVATNLPRLRDSLEAFAHWASNNGVHIVASIEDGPSAKTIALVETEAKHLGIQLSIIPDSRDFDTRYFALTQLLHERRGDAQWAALIDDDTFFPSTSALHTLLARYDATQPHYIGALSEDFFQVVLWGIIAYGGAGIFISMPLLDQLAPHLESCMADPSTGDRRTAACIFNHTTTRLTHEPGLHQVDLKGDATGFYEALRPQPISVHHWKSWNHIPVPAAALVSRICGDSCVFQKYHLLPLPSSSSTTETNTNTDSQNENENAWLLTNGISLTRYSQPLAQSDIRMESTWNPSRGDPQDEMFRHSLAPLKPADPFKVQYLLEAAVFEADGPSSQHRQHENGDVDGDGEVGKGDRVRQFYVRRVTAEKKMEIVEVVWRKGGVVPG